MGALDMNKDEKNRYTQLREISQQEFCDHIEDDDFFLAYGNPLIINGDNGTRLVATAWPLAERLLRMTGRGEEADEVIRRCAEMQDTDNKDISGGLNGDSGDDQRIKYWIYEFEMPDTVKAEFEACCKRYELTKDELFEAAIRYYADLAKNNPEEFRKILAEMKSLKEEECEIQLVRFYPVYKGETEAMALKRKLAETEIWG